MKKGILFIGLMVIVLVVQVSAEQNSINKVEVGVYILSLSKFEIATGSFTVDFYLSLKCSNDCSSADFEFMNGRANSIDKIIDDPKEKFYRIQANLNSPVDLKRYPFDKQKLQIILEDKKNTIGKLVYLPDLKQTGLDNSITFPGWIIGDYNIEIKDHDYEIYGESYSQYLFSIPIERARVSSIIKTFLPVIFIILVMLSSFVLDPDKISTRLGMVGSALVASVMFHVSLTNQIPPVGYLNFADKFMVLTYFILLASFVLNVILMELIEKKKTELVEKMHRRTEFNMLWIVPLLYILLFLVFL